MPTSIPRLADVRWQHREAAARSARIARLQGFVDGVREGLDEAWREIALSDAELVVRRRRLLLARKTKINPRG